MPGRRDLALYDRQKPRRQLLAELHAPLVEGVDAKDHAFDEDAVFIECDQAAQRQWE